MDYLIRLVQLHESFRKPELESLAVLNQLDFKITRYEETSPFCLVQLPNSAAAATLVSRSILSKAIFELWGYADSYDELHQSIKARTSSKWADYQKSSFRFDMDTYQGKRSSSKQREIIESFHYLGFEGPITMKNAEEEFCIFEEWDAAAQNLTQVYFGRRIAGGSRDIILKYDLKKRHYISTTSMDCELALLTANMAHAAKGKMLYDPFVGTGSFTVACGHFGATVLGSDIDGRSIRGKSKEKCLYANFQQYKLEDVFLDSFIADLTNTPLRKDRWIDGIVCDPPYGVREGLKVLGSRDGTKTEPVLLDGALAHLQPNYVPPKRPYSFLAMLDDILCFAADHMVDNGRLSMWMPTANEDLPELKIPLNPHLELTSTGVQEFNKWSRRLLTYRRIPDSQVQASKEKKESYASRASANELNPFRKKFFEGFRSPAGER